MLAIGVLIVLVLLIELLASHHSHRLPHVPEQSSEFVFARHRVEDQVQNQLPPRAYVLNAEPGNYKVTVYPAALLRQSTAPE